MKVTITGQEGFIGYHLYNSIKYKLQDIQIIDFNKNLFKDDKKIDKVISETDIIIHLAGINRSEDQNYLFDQVLENWLLNFPLVSNSFFQSISS